MFTGIVTAVGTVRAREAVGEGPGADARIEIEAGALDLDAVNVGDSIAVSGVCLTVAELTHGAFGADVSVETLSCTTLGALDAGTRVNLEPALTPSTALGGHLVSGHVDGTGTVVSREADARSERLRFEIPATLARYVAPKGSICVDGVSLTVNAVDATAFDVNLVPHTLEVTTLGALRPGDRVNLEVDVIARYLERLLAERAG